MTENTPTTAPAGVQPAHDARIARTDAAAHEAAPTSEASPLRGQELDPGVRS